jgi:hypothetical protein
MPAVNVKGSNGKLKRLLMDNYPMVKTIEDATEDFRGKLLDADISKASSQSFVNCPNARCLKRLNPGCAALVTRTIVLLIKGTRAIRYLVGKKARRIIDMADKEKFGLVGQSFLLRAPDKAHQLGRSRKRTKATGKQAVTVQAVTVTAEPGALLPLASGLRSI